MKRWIPEEYRPLARMITAVTFFGVLMVAALVYLDRISGFFSQLFSILSPFLVGGALAFIQMPITRRGEALLRRTLFSKKPGAKAPRIIAALLSMAVLILFLVLFLNILMPQVISSGGSLVRQVTTFVNENDEAVNSFLIKAGLISADTDSLNSVWQNILTSATNYIDYLPSVLRTSYNLAYSIIFKTLVGLIVSFYLLSDARRLSRKCKKICYALLERDRADRLIRWTRVANQIFAGFTTGKIVDSLVVGVICYLGMMVMGLEYPLIISIVIGVTNVLPFFGPFIGAIPSILILLIVNPISALKFAVFLLILQQVDGNLIGPKILGDYVGISPLLTMAAILIGSGFLGFVGLLISVPLCALLYAICQTYLEERLLKKEMPSEETAFDSLPEPVPDLLPRSEGIAKRFGKWIRERKRKG